jgi:hypothetical protein
MNPVEDAGLRDGSTRETSWAAILEFFCVFDGLDMEVGFEDIDGDNQHIWRNGDGGEKGCTNRDLATQPCLLHQPRLSNITAPSFAPCEVPKLEDDTSLTRFQLTQRILFCL